MSRTMVDRLRKLERKHKPVPELCPFISRNGFKAPATEAEIAAWRAVSPATRWTEVMVMGKPR